MYQYYTIVVIAWAPVRPGSRCVGDNHVTFKVPRPFQPRSISDAPVHAVDLDSKVGCLGAACPFFCWTAGHDSQFRWTRRGADAKVPDDKAEFEVLESSPFRLAATFLSTGAIILGVYLTPNCDPFLRWATVLGISALTPVKVERFSAFRKMLTEGLWVRVPQNRGKRATDSAPRHFRRLAHRQSSAHLRPADEVIR